VTMTATAATYDSRLYETLYKQELAFFRRKGGSQSLLASELDFHKDI